MDRLKLRTVLGSHPHVQALKSGELRSDRFDLDFIEYTPTNRAFKPMVREQAFDVCEMAIVTYLMAKAHGKPLVLLPATMLGRFQHGYALYNPERGTLRPSDLEGKRVGIRSFTTTTGAWIREFWPTTTASTSTRLVGLPLRTLTSPNMSTPPSARRRTRRSCKCCSTVNSTPCSARPRMIRASSRCFDPAAEAAAWYARRGVVPVNHLVVVTEALATSRPDIVAGVYDLLRAGKAKAGVAASPDLLPFGIDANRKPLELIIDYAYQQALIPRRFALEEAL